MLRVYFDICCLKRPYDDQSQPRIAAETQAVLGVVKAIGDGKLVAIRAVAHDLENRLNSDPQRAAAVGRWLESLGAAVPVTPQVEKIARALAEEGWPEFDALHVAMAEVAGADVLLTTDDRLIRRAARQSAILSLKVQSPVAFVQEHTL